MPAPVPSPLHPVAVDAVPVAAVVADAVRQGFRPAPIRCG